MEQDREQRIREHAHALWESEGRPEGRHDHHWRQACEAVDRKGGHTGAQVAPPEAASSGPQSDGSATMAGNLESGGVALRDAPGEAQSSGYA